MTASTRSISRSASAAVGSSKIRMRASRDEQPGDLEQLHLGDAEPLDRRARIDMVEPDGGQQPCARGR